MVAWISRAVYQFPRNATLTHTVDPTSATNLVSGATFTPTTGSLLVVVMEGGVTSTAPGWTAPAGGSAINNTGLYVWHRTAVSGSNSFTTTHNGSDYPIVVAVYEFAAGSTFVKSVAGTGLALSAANPNLTALTGTNLVLGAVGRAVSPSGTSGTVTVAWTGTGTPVEDWDLFALGNNTTDGYSGSVAYVEAFTGASWQPTGSVTASAIGTNNKEALTFAVNVATGSTDNTGALSASVPAVTAAISGSQVNAGTPAATTPRVTASIAGAQVNAGTLNASTLKLTSAITGVSVNAGALTATAPTVTAALMGVSVNAGTLSASAPRATSAFSGASVNTGTFSASTPRVTANIADVATNTGTLAASVPRVTGAIAGASVNPGALTGSTPLPTSTLTGSATNTGTLAATTPRVITFIGDTSVNPGTLTATAPTVTAALMGVSVNAGTLTASTPRTVAALAGQIVNPGTLTGTTQLVVSDVVGVMSNLGALAAVLPVVRFRADDGAPPFPAPRVTVFTLTLSTPTRTLATSTPTRTLELE